MIKRTIYLEKLKSLKDTNLIKVITGVRRSGKSTLLRLFREELIASGVSEANIISLNFEDADYEQFQDRHKLHDYITSNLSAGKNYIFLDEIQNVGEFEKLVDSLYIREDIDIYITGSNAYFLSSDLATVLSGRYVEINIFPLSFTEYVSAFRDQSRHDLLLEQYMTYGSFPEVTNLLVAGQAENVNDYILGVYNTVINKDIVQRNNITDITTLNNISKFLLSNTGSLVSPNKIADYLTSQNNKTSYNTVDKYLSSLVSGLVFYRADREDIRGKQVLQTLQKYYVVDAGLRRAILGASAKSDMGHLLESIVYFELLRRRNFVHVGKNNESEIDFVARNIDTDDVVYYQVAYTAKDQETLERELRPLDAINDHRKKVLLTTDVHEFEENGIKHLNVVNWLLRERK